MFPLGASGDEKSPSVSVTVDPAGSIPADTHLFRSSLNVLRYIFFGLPFSSAVFWHPVHCCMCGSFYLQSEDVASYFPSCKMAWEFLITSSFVIRFCCQMPRIVRRQWRWNTSSLYVIMSFSSTSHPFTDTV